MKDGRKITQHATRNTQRAVELHIEELVLHGFDSGDHYRIGAAVEAELARLFAEKGVPRSLAQAGEMANLDGGSFGVMPGSKAESIGNQVAQALYGGLNR
ncbi:MAG: hypothetical protein IMY75_13650 [Chloroflexi bacterium]|jgi:hypothetical protein|nr:hypothetical protein [Chloroflexota bacterium]